MRVLLWLILLIVSFPLSIQAQTFSIGDENFQRGSVKWSPRNIVDTAKWETLYIHVMKDSLQKNDKAPYEMLAIGDNFRWYGGYGNYQLDSIQRNDPERLIAMSMSEYSNVYRECEPIKESLLINDKDSTLTFHGFILINTFRYEEPLPYFEWTLHDDTCEIMGYDCYKATTRWRGRDWTAWYCDIPVSAGPWKFHGLPGLILRLEDSSGSHRFEAIEIKNIVFPFGYAERLYTKTTRERYNERLLDHQVNYGKNLVESQMIRLSPEEAVKYSKRRQFSCPIELE